MRISLSDCMPILTMLTQATRVATESQLQTVTALYPNFSLTCSCAIARLLASGYLTCDDLAVRVIRLDHPLFRWQPNVPTPDFVWLANALARRFANAPWRRTRLYWATPKAVSLVGGSSGLNRQPLQVQHDLCTTEAYLKFLENNTNPDDHWVGEDALCRILSRRFRRKRPDAVILREMETPVRIIESGGVYTASALRHNHRCFMRERIPYELW